MRLAFARRICRYDVIEVYHAEKQADIIMETRKGVALSYAPEQAVQYELFRK